MFWYTYTLSLFILNSINDGQAYQLKVGIPTYLPYRVFAFLPNFTLSWKKIIWKYCFTGPTFNTNPVFRITEAGGQVEYRKHSRKPLGPNSSAARWAWPMHDAKDRLYWSQGLRAGFVVVNIHKQDIEKSLHVISFVSLCLPRGFFYQVWDSSGFHLPNEDKVEETTPSTQVPTLCPCPLAPGRGLTPLSEKTSNPCHLHRSQSRPVSASGQVRPQSHLFRLCSGHHCSLSHFFKDVEKRRALWRLTKEEKRIKVLLSYQRVWYFTSSDTRNRKAGPPPPKTKRSRFKWEPLHVCLLPCFWCSPYPPTPRSWRSHLPRHCYELWPSFSQSHHQTPTPNFPEGLAGTWFRWLVTTPLGGECLTLHRGIHFLAKALQT